MVSGTGVKRVAVFTAGLMRLPHLAAFLDAEKVVYGPLQRRRPEAIAGWGQKPNTRLPKRLAQALCVPYLHLEDGFLRSFGLGVHGDPPLSVVVDRTGIYYDATQPSDLETLLAYDGDDDPLDDPALLARAERGMRVMRESGLAKYNQAPNHVLPPSEKTRVLVVDQTAGDLSIALGLPAPGGFDAMLAAARREHPDAEILVKTHPDVLADKRRANLHADDVTLLSTPFSSASLLEQVEHVYVMTSLMGCEALIHGCHVTCFGVPFYAGWGLTDDRAAVPSRRGRTRTLPQLFAAAYLRYARYVDPETGERCEAEDTMRYLARAREAATDQPATVVAYGFSAWKRAFVPNFVRGLGNEVRFAQDIDGATDTLANASDPALLVWGIKEPAALRELAESRGVPILRMEDGFLRSVGLGSDLYAPASLVVDPDGIYYDPATPSALERILETRAFDDAIRARARALRERIVETGVSKYNVGVRRHVGPVPGDGRRVVLVVGQVEDDASIQRGCLDVRRNEDLLREARIARPRGYVMYKPHPDVVSGNRRDSLPLTVARQMCDEVVVDASLADCLAAADEVHTMTSLVGFEALLRGRRVVAYGQPFYSGWGLTEDRHPHPRRTRRLSLDELVAGTLLCYPRYVHPNTGLPTTPEAIVRMLASADKPSRFASSWSGRQLRKGVNLAREVIRGL
ncbi:MAG: capsular polysaccharide biosynthesis protein [Sandaracinaceae bacterium]